MSSNSGNSLAKFAFNIYGALNQTPSSESVPSPSPSLGNHKARLLEGYKSNRLVYSFDREVTTLSQLNYPLRNLNAYESEISHHVVAGGRNCLRILALNEDQSQILQDINVLDPSNSLYSNSRVHSTNKLNNLNTIKANGDIIACGLSNGLISIYRVNTNGKCKLLYKLSDHKRCINSLDFIENDGPNQLISGSQDGSIKLWDLRSSTPKPVLTIMSNSHSDPIRSCQYSPHSAVRNKLTILSVHDSGALCKFDVRSPSGNNSQNVFSPDRKWNLHTGPALSLHIHPEKEYVLTGGRDQKMCVWNYSEVASSTNRTIPDHMINTYGPVMKVRWNSFHDTVSSQYGDALESYQQSMDFGRYDDKLSNDDREAFYAINHLQHQANSLYNYDLACSYLNDDSTITVYNLSRKYIPKEIIKAPGNKPFQNFIWAKNPQHQRKLWTITKSNVFSSYELDSPDSTTETDISRPLDELNTIALTWDNDFANMSFINQEKYEFEITDHDSIASENEILEADLDAADHSSFGNYGDENDYKSLDHISSSYDASSSASNRKAIIGSVPVASNMGVFAASATASPIEKPAMLRSHTHNPLHSGKSPSPVPQIRTNSLVGESQPVTSNLSNILRPKVLRTPSQNTQESNFSVQSPQQNASHPAKSKVLLVNHPSPYVVPLSLPLPLNDNAVFEALSNNYLISVPDGFNLIDVCFLNASVAASVNRFRECQIWRLLGVSLEEEAEIEAYDNSESAYKEEIIEDFPRKGEEDDSKSISSDIGNFVGSYNSNSTSTTNYGNGSERKESNNELKQLTASPPKDDSKLTEHKNTSNSNLMDLISQNRGNSFSSPNAGWPSVSRKNSSLSKNHQYRNTEENETAIIDDDDDDVDKDRVIHGTDIPHAHSRRASARNSKRDSLYAAGSFESRSSPIGIRSPINTVDSGNSLENSPQNDRHRPSFGAQHRWHVRSNSGLPAAEDLDNENLNILQNAAVQNMSQPGKPQAGSASPGYFNQSHQSFSHHHHHHGSTGSGSMISRRNSSIQGPHYRSRHSPGQQPFLLNEANSRSELNIVPETPEPTSGESIKRSELSKVLYEKKEKEALNFAKPWKTQTLLKRSLDYAANQGDIILCATLTLLFYDTFSNEISRQAALDWLALYVDILRRKRIFVTAANVINCSPKDILADLKTLASKEVDLRFFCSVCQKLLVNEKSKSESKDHFGYWYCDECSSRQSNCIYCNEPCKGLVVAVSLKCGHKGHFGCLKEWFITGENAECPGGCDYVVI